MTTEAAESETASLNTNVSSFDDAALHPQKGEFEAEYTHSESDTFGVL